APEGPGPTARACSCVDGRERGDSVVPMKYFLRHTPRVLLFLALAFSVSSCGGWLLAPTAKSVFSEQQSCPKDRTKISYVVVRPQDVFETPAPPAEVAADPDRLKVW